VDAQPKPSEAIMQGLDWLLAADYSNPSLSRPLHPPFHQLLREAFTVAAYRIVGAELIDLIIPECPEHI
jgi:hypothetical protein